MGHYLSAQATSVTGSPYEAPMAAGLLISGCAFLIRYLLKEVSYLRKQADEKERVIREAHAKEVLELRHEYREDLAAMREEYRQRLQDLKNKS